MYTREYNRQRNKLKKIYPYQMIFWADFDFSHLRDLIMVKHRGGRKNITFNDIIIMADTETSKKPLKKQDNHIVAWSISFRAYHENIATLWGQDPWDFCSMLQKLRDALDGDDIYVYFHNLGYDWQFLKKFLLAKFGTPKNQLNLRPYAPLFVKFENGIMLKDSLVLAARSLDRWGKDLKIEHQKALGKWDYNKYRNQSDVLTDDELLYIENDVRGGVECIDATCQLLKKNISSIPYTSTGIVRDITRKNGKKHKAHEMYEKLSPTWRIQQIMEIVFHGGYTHSNRYCTVGGVNRGIYPAVCYDFSSSYPYCMLAFKYPMEEFFAIERTYNDFSFVHKNEDYAFLCHCTFTNIRLKDPRFPMPMLSMYKAIGTYDPINDNGRAVSIKLCEYYLNEIDIKLIEEYYEWDALLVDGVYIAFKDYLPRWFTDQIYDGYKKKSELKGVDDVLYSLEKSKFNAYFGMCVQKPVAVQIDEDYSTGEYKTNIDFDYAAEYEKHVKNRNSFLPYQWGAWVTSYAQANLFELGKCVNYEKGGIWLYSDTDSVYGTEFNEERIKKYNDGCIKRLKDRGYDPVVVNGKTFNLGIAEYDGEYMQFKTLHSKCYCDRPLIAGGDGFVMGGDLMITVAGVPKKTGAKCLKNNIEAFKPGFVFDGITTGKLGHTHIHVDDIYTDHNGNVTGDSIDLKPCDYILSEANRNNILYTDYMEVELTLGGYEDEELQLSFFNDDVLQLF